MARLIGTVSSGRRRAPDVPTIGTATDVGTGRAYNNGAATVTFTAPSYNGGLPVTSYTVTSSPGGFTASGASSPLTVTGLASNTAYTFTVTATNAAGTSSASSASNSITATTVPQAPTIGSATDGGTGTTVSVAFTAGATGGSAVTTYTATSSPGSITGTGAASPITVSGLTTGTAYTFTVTATNANGTSTASAASNSVTPVVPSSWETIAVVNASGNPTSLTLSSIPNTYEHLQLRVSIYCAASNNEQYSLRLNSGTSTQSINMFYQGSAGVYDQAGKIYYVGRSGRDAANNPGILIFDIPKYTSGQMVRSGIGHAGAISPSISSATQTITSNSVGDLGTLTEITLSAQGYQLTSAYMALYGMKG